MLHRMPISYRSFHVQKNSEAHILYSRKKIGYRSNGGILPMKGGRCLALLFLSFSKVLRFWKISWNNFKFVFGSIYSLLDIKMLKYLALIFPIYIFLIHYKIEISIPYSYSIFLLFLNTLSTSICIDGINIPIMKCKGNNTSQLDINEENYIP